MNPQEFIAKWKPVSLSERSAAQQHFLDLCDLLGQPKPAAADPEGTWYTYIDTQDIDEIIDVHLVGGKIVERVKI